MAKLVSNATTISKSINWKGISENTERMSFTDVESIEWKNIKELHILGSQQADYDQVSFWNDDILVKQYGCYISLDRTWVQRKQHIILKYRQELISDLLKWRNKMKCF